MPKPSDLCPWVRPYPPEDQLAYAICGDPVALAYARLEEWLAAQTFKPPVTMDELVGAIYSMRFAVKQTMMADSSFTVYRNGQDILNKLPDDLYYQAEEMFGKREKGK